MTDTVDITRRSSFDNAPDLYARARPGYPEAVFDHICQFAGVGPGSRALEIGCGPGTATVPMARRGLSITAVEVGPNMVRYASRAARGLDVRFHCAAFEDWPLPPEPFDLVYAGSSFHWVQPEVRYVRSAEALRPGGTLALFWNSQARPRTADPFLDALQEVYAAEAPDLARRFDPADRAERARTERVAEIEQSGRFGPVTVMEFPFPISYTGDTYTALLSTYSDHATLDPEVRQRLLTAVKRVIDERFGGRITRTVTTALFLAKRP